MGVITSYSIHYTKLYELQAEADAIEAGVRKALADGVLQTWALDIDRRLNGLQPSPARGYQGNVRVVEPGVGSSC